MKIPSFVKRMTVRFGMGAGIFFLVGFVLSIVLPPSLPAFAVLVGQIGAICYLLPVIDKKLEKLLGSGGERKALGQGRRTRPLGSPR